MNGKHFVGKKSMLVRWALGANAKMEQAHRARASTVIAYSIGFQTNKGPTMVSLVDALKTFNRKERYWLLRNAIGSNFELLDVDFRKRLGDAIGISIPQTAWWAMDYHLDWLIAALHLFGGGQKGVPVDNSSNGVQGTQEDMDLVVAFDNVLVLIEAKGETSWSNSQLKSKVDRLSAIFATESFRGVDLKFLLMSPNKSEKLERTGGWPKWMSGADGQPLFIPLTMDGGPAGFSKVARCDKNGKTTKDGKSWKVEKVKTGLVTQ